jgi:phenylacetate-CoA ligase
MGLPVNNFITTHVLAPTLDLLRGTRTLKCLQELEDSQWWPRDKILELQNQRLRKLVEHAYTTVPAYRRVFDERGIEPGDIASSEDLVKLPIITKRFIRDNFDDMVSRGYPKREIIVQSTGGSTGEAMVFYRSKQERMSWNYAASFRGYRWAEYEIGDKLIGIGQVVPSNSVGEGISQSLRYFFEGIMRLDAADMSPEMMPVLTARIARFNPRYFRGYPSALQILAQFIEEEGKYTFRPRAVFTGAEMVYDYQRELFRKVFGCETYSHYCSFELHPIAVECPTHSGHHISAENVIVEIVNDEGEIVPAGEEGRILLTNLHNYAMPFIRYDIGDRGVLATQDCPCGRGLPLLSTLVGRSDDVIITRSGRRIPGTVLHRRFLAFFGVEHIQIVQESYQKITVRLVVNKHSTKEQIDKITYEVIKEYKRVLGEDIEIAVEFVDRMPLTPMGKQRVVVSKLSQQMRDDEKHNR